jgi:hypothetical protein
MSQIRDITYNGVTFKVEFNATPGRPGRMHMANGDPGYPDEPAEIEIINIKLEGNDQDLSEMLQAGQYLYGRTGKKVPDAFDEIETRVYELDDLFEREEP